ncbi:hypothetical protein NC652_007931 [Populus alba x Populus x berolinensis]|nr:hypothetical protein NC652_007931 [Populus alba x Populus x berolinensis]
MDNPSTKQVPRKDWRGHTGSATLAPVPRLAARLRSTRLGLARLAVDDVADGSHYVDMLVDWSMHADKTCGARLRACVDALPESDGECGHPSLLTMAAIFFDNGSYIIVESCVGTHLPDPVTIHCSTTSGRLVFTRGWHDIARDAGLKSGDTVTFYKEVNGGA